MFAKGLYVPNWKDTIFAYYLHSTNSAAQLPPQYAPHARHVCSVRPSGGFPLRSVPI